MTNSRTPWSTYSLQLALQRSGTQSENASIFCTKAQLKGRQQGNWQWMHVRDRPMIAGAGVTRLRKIPCSFWSIRCKDWRRGKHHRIKSLGLMTHMCIMRRNRRYQAWRATAQDLLPGDWLKARHLVEGKQISCNDDSIHECPTGTMKLHAMTSNHPLTRSNIVTTHTFWQTHFVYSFEFPVTSIISRQINPRDIGRVGRQTRTWEV